MTTTSAHASSASSSASSSSSTVGNPQHALVAGRELGALLKAGGDPLVLASYLDAMEPQARIAAVRTLSRKALGELWQHCASAPPLTMDEFLPSSVAVGQTEIFSGLNSLPLFRKFEKRFARTAGGTVIGYNHQLMAFVTGPGYFMVDPAGSELLIDYTKVPTQEQAPAGWPKVKPNDRGLSMFVYKNMHDFCRRVSRDVVIGQATRLGKPIHQYFVLVRGAVA